MTDLFDLDRPGAGAEAAPAADTPLADRMRPRSLDEVEGPEEVVGGNGFLRRAIAEDRVPSSALGPAGRRQNDAGAAGRGTDGLDVPPYSAVATGVKEIRKCSRAPEAAQPDGQAILFLDDPPLQPLAAGRSCRTSSPAMSC
jgi:putative ATPase